MNKKIVMLVNLCLLFTLACKNHEAYSEAVDVETESSVDYAESELNEYDSIMVSKAATQQLEGRSFLRKADINFEVKNVYQTTVEIENKAAELGGFVSLSDLKSYALSKSEVPMNRDSTNVIKKYYVRSNLRVHIPQKELGEFLHSLSSQVEFLNHRKISSEDVELNFEAYQLAAKNAQKTQKQLDDLLKENGKITDKANIIGSNSYNTDSQINKHIENKRLKDQVNFSEVTIAIYEPEKVIQSKVLNTHYLEKNLEPEIGYEVTKAFNSGWFFMKKLMILCLYVWPLWLMVIVFLVIYRYRKNISGLIS